MAQFVYAAANQDGAILQGEIEAAGGAVVTSTPFEGAITLDGGGYSIRAGGAEPTTLTARLLASRSLPRTDPLIRRALVDESFRQELDQRLAATGDAEAARIYAESFGRDPQFAQFYRSLEAYKASFSKKSDVMVLDPSSSEFFKVFRGGSSSPAVQPARK